MQKRNLAITIVLCFIGIIVVAGFIASQQYTASHQSAQKNDIRSQETAYQNIVKESLNVYHSRYSKYPNDYSVLLDDISKSQDIYGVNGEGMSELKDIKGRLTDFSYTKISDDDYLFTYQETTTGETITVTSK